MHDRDPLTLESAFDFARDSIKSLILINGASAVALLTFYGSLIKDGKVDLAICTRYAAFAGLLFFAVGVLAGALAGAFAYLTQLLWGGASRSSEEANPNHAVAGKWHFAALIAAAFSVIAFVLGVALSGLALFQV